MCTRSACLQVTQTQFIAAAWALLEAWLGVPRMGMEICELHRLPQAVSFTASKQVCLGVKHLGAVCIQAVHQDR